MEIFGDPIFAKNPDGSLKSRIGTVFLNSSALVTKCGVHSTQRMLWLKELSQRRIAAGKTPLTDEEASKEMEQSVDVVFSGDYVLIRPEPGKMDLAFRADKLLQSLLSKRRIRYLNMSSHGVRAALCERGENWRMARQPISQEDISELIERSKVAISDRRVYFYNKFTGTRFITAGIYDELSRLPDDEYLFYMKEVVDGLNRRNRHGQPEIDVFPRATPRDIVESLRQFKFDDIGVDIVRQRMGLINARWRMALPAELREETSSNYEWRNEMCYTITRRINETSAEEKELLSGIAPEFYRQIEWMPGARLSSGELIFDEIWAEAQNTDDPETLALCDPLVKALILNSTRLFSDIDFINVGRISHSLARRPDARNRRGNVYVLQYRETGKPNVSLLLVRFQKWGVKERLDEGKDIARAMLETDEYTDYILDRRLMCRQLGMRLSQRVGYGYVTERYNGEGQYHSMPVRTPYFVRPYVPGTASDKIAPARFHNPVFARSFARLMGEAAAVDVIVARRSSATGEVLFDKNYEIISFDSNSLPASLTVTDHAGAFVGYTKELIDSVKDYADVVRRRKAFVFDYAGFVSEYVKAFAKRFAEIQASYLERRAVYDGLFKDRPFDPNGSAAFRWYSILSKLEKANVDELASVLEKAAIE